MTDPIFEAANLIKEFEGFRPSPYLCPAGSPTIGYGTRYYPNGEPVSLTDPPITEAQASDFLAAALAKIAPTLPGLTGHRLAAVLSFAYNVGVGAYLRSTLRQFIDNGEWGEAQAEFSRWVFVGRNHSDGLALRRSREAELFGEGP